MSLNVSPFFEGETVLKNKQLEELKDAIHSAGHDMSSPLTVIKSYVQFFKMIENEDMKLEVIANMLEASDRLEGVIKGLVELADTYQSGHMPAEDLSFDHVFNDVIYNLIYEINLNNVKIKSDFSNGQDIHYIKPFLVKIMYHLLKNAIQYSEHQPSPVVKVSTTRKKDHIILEITDNGIGIDLEHGLEKLFKPFKRLTHQGKGRGLGLALIKVIIEKNGGSMLVKSTPLNGTHITVKLVPYKLTGIIHKSEKRID